MAKCLVIPTSKLKEHEIWKKLFINNSITANAIFIDDSLKKNIYALIEDQKDYKERFNIENLEQNERWQQVICYFLVRQDQSFYAYIRSEKSQDYLDSRMGQKVSVGLGGHIYKEYGKLNKAIISCLKNEVVFKIKDNNVDIKNNLIDLVGVVKDNRDEVGRMHFGLIYIVDVDKSIDIELITKENFQGWFVTYSKFMHEIVYNKECKYKIEGWSQLILDRILPYLT